MSESQHTLAGRISFEGVGLHTGRTVHVTLSPAAADSGIGFVRTDVTDKNNRVRAAAEAVCQTRLGTVIGNAEGVTVSTVEHLMAAFCALGVDNAVVELDGPEAPIMDGSAQPFVELLDRAGRQAQGAPRRWIEILAPVEVVEGDKRAALTPAPRFEMAFEILFDAPAIGRQTIDLPMDEATFRAELAEARTFGFMHEFEQLKAAGLARGASMENVTAIEDGRVLNPDGVRRVDDFVRHKAIDAIGDLYLLGAPILGRFEARYSGHALNNALVRALLDRPQAWRFVSRTSPATTAA
ncbi:MAG: UDP-3-O-acyl-N-acetylglucosamine deacetylase [Caulobacterales bacterium]